MDRAVERFPALFVELAGFFDAPADLLRLGSLRRDIAGDWCADARSANWEQLYARQWPAFHACWRQQGEAQQPRQGERRQQRQRQHPQQQQHQPQAGADHGRSLQSQGDVETSAIVFAVPELIKPARRKLDWLHIYRETSACKVGCVLEVMRLERTLDVAIAATPARVVWIAKYGCYLAKYLDGSTSVPEVISKSAQHRFRACEVSKVPKGQQVRDDACSLVLDVEGRYGSLSPQLPTQHDGLVDTAALRPGAAVELQWKLTPESSYGWWLGMLEDLERDVDGITARAVVAFPQMLQASSWHRLPVQFGDSQSRPCPLGGFTGGIRAVTADGLRRWVRFRPDCVSLAA